MVNLIRIFLYVLVNVAGWYTIQVIYILASKYGLQPELQVQDVPALKWWYFTVALWIWLGSVVLSVGYFFAKDELKNWLLLAPMYTVAIYCTAVLIYFNLLY